MQHAAPIKKTTVFFPNLDGLRFLSFLAVFLYHCYLSFFSHWKTTNPEIYEIISFLFRNGYLGVNFFFVLSGFLITFLLIRERDMNGTIHIGKFYVRRILRIWPLYYLCIVIGFVLFPLIKQMSGESAQENADLDYYIFFAANFDYMHNWPLRPEAILLSVLWSVAVEEQFYLSWPVLLKYISSKIYPFIFPAIVLFSLLFRSMYIGPTEADHAVRYFHTFSLIGDMAMGGLFAYLLSYESGFKKMITGLRKPYIVLIYIGTVLLVLFKNIIFPSGFPIIWERFVISIFFGLIIVEQNFSDHSLFKIGRWRLVSKLGIYTYGLYCLHLLGMYLTVKLFSKFGFPEGNFFVGAGAAVLSLLFSIAISLGSYHLFEKWFLRLKDRFAFVVKAA